MKLLEVRTYPDPVLRLKSTPVEEVTKEEIKLLEDMEYTMHEESGVGLAAPQVGISKRIIVVDIGEGTIPFINPEVIEEEGKETMEEGCLSMPGVTVNVTRSARIVVSYLDSKGEKKKMEAEGLLARVILHEIDHLDGKLLFDYLSPWKKMVVGTGWGR